MAQHFFPLTVKSVVRETAEAICVEFDLNDALQQQFNFEAGQHLTLKKEIDGEELRRNYSICASPNDEKLQIGIKQMPYGKFSTWANQHLQTGDRIEVMNPTGQFTIHGSALQARSFVFVAAGSGITPILSLLSWVLQSLPQATCTLIYVNRNRSSIMFREKLEALKNRYMQRFQLIHLLTREATDSPVNHGRLTAEKCGTIFGHMAPLNASTHYYLCGPLEMVQSTRKFLEANNVPGHHIHAELFGIAGLPAKKEVVSAKENAEKSLVATVLYRLDGVEATLVMEDKDMSVLDAVRNAGADAPFACKGGVCCTCKAKLLEGTVAMDVVYGLEPEEIEAGYILTCQAHPTSPLVKISYDD